MTPEQLDTLAKRERRMRERLIEIDKELMRAQGWASKLTPLIEERRAILINLGFED